MSSTIDDWTEEEFCQEIWSSISLISARRVKGWWEVKVQCAPMGPFYIGKKDRSYFSALKKSLDEATKKTE